MHCWSHTMLCHLYGALLVPYIAVPSLQCFSGFLQTLHRHHRRTLPLPKMAFRETLPLVLEVKERVEPFSTASLRLEISFQLSPPLPLSLGCKSICPHPTLLNTWDYGINTLSVQLRTPLPLLISCRSVHPYPTLLNTRDIMETVLLVCSSVNLYLYSYPVGPSTLTTLYLIPDTLWN